MSPEKMDTNSKTTTSNNRKRQNGDNQQNDNKRMKYTATLIPELKLSDKPTTAEEQIQQLQNVTKALIGSHNELIKQNRTLTETVNRNVNEIKTIAKDVNNLHHIIHRDCVVIKHLGINLTNMDEAKKEVGRLTAFIMNDSNTTKITSFINEITSLDKESNKISKTNEKNKKNNVPLLPNVPLSIKVKYLNINIAQTMLKNASVSNNFVRKNTTITNKIWISECKSREDANLDSKIGKATQLLHEYFKLRKTDNEDFVTPTIKRHFRKLKINGETKTHTEALQSWAGITIEEFEEFIKFFKTNNATSEEVQKWIKQHKPHAFSKSD
uniref:Uncharacterized protein n=1 Tax=Panagrolaimus sp. PS1159 TaxID=55785 RepID=A0AC35GMJ7_9BILA